MSPVPTPVTDVNITGGKRANKKCGADCDLYIAAVEFSLDWILFQCTAQGENPKPATGSLEPLNFEK